MARIIALSVAFVTLALPAFAEDKVDTAKVTCKEYLESDHNLMVAMESAFHEAMKNDPKLGSLNEAELSLVMWDNCTGKPDVKVIDALQK
ncbi:HdeA/HdeB family chaperone [Mesorhizobium sp. WSM3859]|uniref:HdeA/HdeB family chaperone n=1 Tax=Mesorhizobium sp. WSM3859 TaxID=2029402 RepID=UPI0011410B86|nr:HdeA/HdeB family chaperone [Mesorhizobium sp. WSM3859]